MVCYTIATSERRVAGVCGAVSVARWFVILLLLESQISGVQVAMFQLLGGLLYYCYDLQVRLHRTT